MVQLFVLKQCHRATKLKKVTHYTYSIVDLTNFNKRYHTNYYTRAYKRFDASTDTTVELVDKNTGNVVETRTVSASSGIQKFTTTKAASNGELTWQVDYDKGLGAGPGRQIHRLSNLDMKLVQVSRL